MKKTKLVGLVTLLAVFISTISTACANTASIWWVYQPREPKSLK